MKTPSDPKVVQEFHRFNVFQFAEKGYDDDWEGNCFIYPPDHRGSTISAWIAKAVITTRRQNSIVMLVLPNTTQRQWFQRAINWASTMTFVRGEAKCVALYGHLPISMSLGKLLPLGWTFLIQQEPNDDN